MRQPSPFATHERGRNRKSIQGKRNTWMSWPCRVYDTSYPEGCQWMSAQTQLRDSLDLLCKPSYQAEFAARSAPQNSRMNSHRAAATEVRGLLGANLRAVARSRSAGLYFDQSLRDKAWQWPNNVLWLGWSANFRKVAEGSRC